MNAPRTVERSVALGWADQPRRELLRLAGPMIVSLLSVTAMTVVDTLFIGWLGSKELAATGIGGMCVMTILSFGSALLGAARVAVGEAVGRGDAAFVRSELGSFLRVAAVLGVLGTAVLGIVGWLLWRYVDMGLARDYVWIRALSSPLVLGTQAIAQWRQARGDAASPMRATLFANVLHIPLDAWFVFGLGLGVRGAAVATLASALAELVWLWLSQKPEGFFLREASAASVLDTLRRGLPTGLERVLDMIAFTLVPLLLASVGDVHVAAHQIVLQVSLTSFLPLIALSEATSILVSQAVGALHTSLVRRLAKISVATSVAYAVILAVVFFALARPLVLLFNQEPRVVEIGTATLRVAAFLQLVNAVYNSLKGVLRGLSDLRFVAVVTVACAWVITPPLTWFWGVAHGQGAAGAWLVLCVETALGSLILTARLLRNQIFRGA